MGRVPRFGEHLGTNRQSLRFNVISRGIWVVCLKEGEEVKIDPEESRWMFALQETQY